MFIDARCRACGLPHHRESAAYPEVLEDDEDHHVSQVHRDRGSSFGLVVKRLSSAGNAVNLVAASAVLATVIPANGRGWGNIIRWVLVKKTIRLQ
jgi:hypothetical protein